jgi:hypothetical protein
MVARQAVETGSPGEVALDHPAAGKSTQPCLTAASLTATTSIR